MLSVANFCVFVLISKQAVRGPLGVARLESYSFKIAPQGNVLLLYSILRIDLADSLSNNDSEFHQTR